MPVFNRYINSANAGAKNTKALAARRANDLLSTRNNQSPRDEIQEEMRRRTALAAQNMTNQRPASNSGPKLTPDFDARDLRPQVVEPQIRSITQQELAREAARQQVIKAAEAARQNAEQKQQSSTQTIENRTVAQNSLERINQLSQLSEADQAKEREALASSLEADKARQVLETRARSGFAGLGLSGAAQALESDISRKATRDSELAKAELARGQRAEQGSSLQAVLAAQNMLNSQDLSGRADSRADKSLDLQERTSDRQLDIQEEAARRAAEANKVDTWLLEEELDQDVDGDGISGNPDTNAQETSTQQRRDDVIARLRAENQTKDLYGGDADTGPGTKEEPFKGMSRAEMEKLGLTFSPEIYDFWGFKHRVYKDNLGNYWVFD